MNDNLFSCKFNSHNQDYLLQIKLFNEIKPEDTQKIIINILENAFKNGQIHLKNSVINVIRKEDHIEYRTSKKGSWSVLSSDLKEKFENSHVEKLKIQRLSAEFFPRRSRNFKEIRNSLLKKWPAKTPLISFFWKALVVPIAKIAALIPPRKSL